ncbi:MAG: hypothetical protein HRT38_13115 [Alteromonadaceae bacterium]|nr:hypothetical protein [Alteromonadaceae bacterium]
MNKFYLASGFALGLFCSGAYATDYYVSSTAGSDTNDGLSISAPWASLAHVSNAAILPGDNIYFKAGETFVGQLSPSYSGSAALPIKFAKYDSGSKPIINGSGGSSGDYTSAIFINNQQYFEFDNLEITNNRKVAIAGQPDTTAYGIDVWNNGSEVMSYFKFTNLTLRDIFPVELDKSNFNQIKSAAINFKSEKNSVVGEEKHIRDVTVDNCYITMTAKFGIWSRHPGGAEGIGDDIINRNYNFVLTNNHTYKTGGSGMTPGNTYNILVENNLFEYPGASDEPRMAGRGSGAWFFNTRNVLAQHNVSKHARGSGDSYGMHVDHSNKYVLFQYNYSEDSEGGFAEILGNNEYSTYRYNISVNDGFRDNHGNTLWVSQYPSDKAKSQHNYIYNNSVYINKTLTGTSLTTGIDLDGDNTYVYNNAFYVATGATMGEKLLSTSAGSGLDIDNNMFYGTVASGFTSSDSNAMFNDPQYLENGSLTPEGYKLLSSSSALDQGRAVVEPPFPEAGQGIFAHISAAAVEDYFGNPVDLSVAGDNVGAYNGAGVGPVVYEAEEATLLGGLKTSSCANFSAGEAVKATNTTKILEFGNITADVAGYYTLTISAYSKTNSSISYQVNGGDVETAAVTGAGIWCYEGAVPTDIPVVVYLNAGNNIITFTDSAVIDKIKIADDVEVDYEAESAVLNGTAVTTSCTAASQGEMVKKIGINNANSILFNNVEAPTNGIYPVNVQYYATAAHDLGIAINGGAITTYSVPASGNWCFVGGTPGSVELNLPLESGLNSIEVTNLTVIDKITVKW